MLLLLENIIKDLTIDSTVKGFVEKYDCLEL